MPQRAQGPIWMSGISPGTSGHRRCERFPTYEGEPFGGDEVLAKECRRYGTRDAVGARRCSGCRVILLGNSDTILRWSAGRIVVPNEGPGEFGARFPTPYPMVPQRGGVAEWLKAAVLKAPRTARPLRTAENRGGPLRTCNTAPATTIRTHASTVENR